MTKLKSTGQGLRPSSFLPNQRVRAQAALERIAFAYPEVTEVERRDTLEGTEFVVWAACEVDGLPSHVLGYPVRLRVEPDNPRLLA